MMALELDALALKPELDGLLWKNLEICVGAMMLIRYGQHEIFTNGSVGVVKQAEVSYSNKGPCHALYCPSGEHVSCWASIHEGAEGAHIVGTQLLLE